MNADFSPLASAARLMSRFATRTGLSAQGQDQRRYLWTDAFAVCNFLELFERTGQQDYRRYAAELIARIHSTLGRHRDDDPRRGWISGFDEAAGCRHPTAGGLRIGKPLKERGPHDPFDERLEWDRDGQYFHYLTKWIHALCHAAPVLGVHSIRWAVELGAAAFDRFARRSASGAVVGVYWKMSIDLSRPLVAASGLHDALDGFITLREAHHAAAKAPANADLPDLSAAVDSLAALCRQQNWTTDDPLGLGGLLFDACRICQLLSNERPGDAQLLQEIMQACCNSLAALLAARHLDRPLSHRLPFRELGLAIGLSTLPTIAAITDGQGFERRAALSRAVDLLLPHQSIGEQIVRTWLPRAQQPDANWQAHQDINDVMLATALIPGTFISVGERLAPPDHDVRA
jgi:hypothetical protein